MQRRFNFWWRYLRGNTPWDTQIVPPEIVALADTLKAGRALDIGCGTGTTSLYLAQKGWQVVGVDFIPSAIGAARQKAQQAGQHIAFHIGDASQLNFLSGPFDLAVDVGCLHSLPRDGWRGYATHLARLTTPGALYALYAFAPRISQGNKVGLNPTDVETLFSPAFTIETVVLGHDKGTGPESAWYTLRRV